jgi:hypothetical protein
VDIYKVEEEVKELRFVGDELRYLRNVTNRIRVKLVSRDLARSGAVSEQERMTKLKIVGSVGSIVTNAVGRGMRQLTLTGTDVPVFYEMLDAAGPPSDLAGGTEGPNVHELTPREYEIHELTRSTKSVATISNLSFIMPPFLR